MSRLEVRDLGPEHLDAAAELLAARHRAHVSRESLLDDRHGDLAVARSELAAALGSPSASGVAGFRDGRLVGYLLGDAKDAAGWGPNAWVEAAGVAATDPEVVRELYGAIAGRWVGEGRTNHHVLVPAADAVLVDAWFSLDFGQQHVHAIREAVPVVLVPRSELVVRAPDRADLPVLAELELVLPHHLTNSPVFSRNPVPSVEEVSDGLAADLENPAYAWFVVEHGGRVVGSAIGCALEQSSTYAGPNRPRDAALLGYAAVFPEARGLGAGRLLGEAVLDWAAGAGYRRIVTDWRSANLEADRAWRGLGFRPTFRRLHRLIG